MKALFFDGTLQYVIDYPLPKREKGEALIRVLFAGLCNTDVEIMRGYMEFRGVLGHEFVGIVEECDKKEWVGRRIVGEINCGCGVCELCRNGSDRHCSNRTVLGILGRDGAFAEYLTLPVENLHEVPEDIRDEEAVFVEPLGAAFRIREQVPIAPSKRVIVLGDGKLGLLVAQVMNMFPCDLTVIGKHKSKLQFLENRGFKTSLLGTCIGEEADYVIDCTGSPQGFEYALQLAHPQGMVVLKSTYSEKGNFDLAPIVMNEITVVGSRCGPFDAALHALVESTVDVKPLITKIMPLERGEEAFGIACEKESLKVLLEISP